MTSLDAILAGAAAAGLDRARLSAADLYTRSLDCHNIGGFPLVERIVGAIERIGAPKAGAVLLDVGCGLGGPGRCAADRLGCRVVGIDLVPARVEVASELARLTGASASVEYRIAEPTALPFADASFDLAWMLDASIHVRDKRALFGELARVLRPEGLLVLHDQMGPLTRAMRPAQRRAPWLALSLTQLIGRIEAAGMRLLLWEDTTRAARAFFRAIQERLPSAVPLPDLPEGYVKTLEGRAGRTGFLIARRW